MARRPFSMLRACFYLLAAVIAVEVAGTIIAAGGCFYLNLATVQTIGACLPVTQVIREQWAEILSAILALLVASKNGNGPPPPGPPANE